jgi:pilus assembly protein CpaB
VRASTIVMIGFAVVFGLIAAFLAQSWLTSKAEERMRTLEAQNRKQPIATQTIVVAKGPLRFGAELTSSSLREQAWPGDALPAGAFRTIQELTSNGKRVVLASFEANEPILNTKITGPGQRATLSAVLNEGMKAVTIRVNDIEGVAGFVLPGERVDVVLTRQYEKGNAVNDVVMQNARVLAIDQLADERSEKPSVARAVTLEVDIAGAQKLMLAAQVGTLSLALRKAGEVQAQDTRRITNADLSNADVGPREDRRFVSIQVIRSGKTASVYSVPRDGVDTRSLAGVGSR